MMPGLQHVNMYGLHRRSRPGHHRRRRARAQHLERGASAASRTPVSRSKTCTPCIVTHSHPDHFGCAGRLANEANAQLVTHNNFRMFWNGQRRCATTATPTCATTTSCLPRIRSWARPRGAATTNGIVRRCIGGSCSASCARGSSATTTCPNRRAACATATCLRLAGRDMFAVHTPGHTLDHLCIHDPEGGLVFTGDHVLPHITPYISGLAGGSNPLLDYFASLERTAALADVNQAMPAHGVVIDNSPQRVQGDHRAPPRALRQAAQGFAKSSARRRRCASFRSSCSVPRSSAPWPTASATPTSNGCAKLAGPIPTVKTANSYTR